MPIIFPDELCIPKSFCQAFYDKNKDKKYDKAPYMDEMRNLFYEIVFGLDRDEDKYKDNKVLYYILAGKNGNAETHTFLSNLFQHGTNYANKRIITYILDYLTQNNAENFYLFLHRIDQKWNDTKVKWDVPKRNLQNFCNDYSQIINWLETPKKIEPSTLKKTTKKKSTTNKDDVQIVTYDHVYQYFEYIDRLKEKKPAYAYGLIVLWTLINENCMYLEDLISKIIIYKEDPTTDFQSGKKYIIKSAMNKPTKNDDVFLSVRRVFEPLSESEESTTERDILFSVTSALFHSENSVFTIERCNRRLNQDDNQSDTEELINEHKAAELLKSFQHLFKPNVPDLSKSLVPSKTEPYYIKVGKKYLTYNSWYVQTRIILKERPDSKSRWRFAKSPDSVSIYNCGQPVNIFALDIPNGTQTIPTVMWCFPSLSQAAQKFTIHEVIDW